MAGFVQIIEFKTSRIKEIEELGRPSRTEGSTPATFRRLVATADRDHPGTYFTIVDFESSDSAMENSGRPEMAEFAAKMAELWTARRGPTAIPHWARSGSGPWSTAMDLLDLRDELVLNGWTGVAPDGSTPKLKALASLEQGRLPLDRAFADHPLELVHELESDATAHWPLGISQLTLQHPRKSFPAIWQRLIGALERCGVGASGLLSGWITVPALVFGRIFGNVGADAAETRLWGPRPCASIAQCDTNRQVISTS